MAGGGKKYFSHCVASQATLCMSVDIGQKAYLNTYLSAHSFIVQSLEGRGAQFSSLKLGVARVKLQCCHGNKDPGQTVFFASLGSCS